MINETRYKDKILFIVTDRNSKDIDMGIPIHKVINTEQYIIILLDGHYLLDTQNHNCNIVCLDEEGVLLWRVSNPDLVSLSKERTHNYFTGIAFKEGGKIEAFTWDCFLVDIDIKTGKFIGEWTFTK